MRLTAQAPGTKSVDLKNESHDFKKPIGALSVNAQKSQTNGLKRYSGR
jgi:hypothetical protein